MRLARMLVLGVVLAFGYSLVTAADEDKDIKAAVLKLAAALEKNDQAAAKKLYGACNDCHGVFRD